MWDVHCADFKIRNINADVIFLQYIHIYIYNTKIRHWLNFWAVGLIWLRHELLRDIMYLSFGFWDQYSEAKPESSHISSCWRNSWITNHVTREEGRVRSDPHRWTSASSTNVSHILAVSFFSLQIYIPHTFLLGARGGVVVKALRYKPAGRGFDSRWCHWNFSVT